MSSSLDPPVWVWYHSEPFDGSIPISIWIEDIDDDGDESGCDDDSGDDCA